MIDRKLILRSAVGTALGLLVLIGGLCSYAKWQAYRAQRDAEGLLLDLRSLRLDRSSFDDVNRIAARHRRYRHSLLASSAPICSSAETSGDVCYFDFGYENSLLTHLRLAPVMMFGVRVQVYHQRVGGISVDLVCGQGTGAVGVLINESPQLPTGRNFEVSEVSNVRGLTSIRLTPNAPQRNQVYALDLKCLGHIGRCPDRSELLPDIARKLGRIDD